MTKLADVKDRAERRVVTGRQQDELARYEKATRLFEAVMQDAERIAAIVVAYRDADIDLGLDDQLAGHLRQSASTLVTDAPGADGIRIEEIASNVERMTRDVAHGVETAAAVALERWIAAQPRPTGSFVAVLAASAPDQAAAARHALAHFDDLSSASPAEAADIERIAAAAASLRDAYAGLAATAPEAVREFLENAPDGLPLAAVPDQVIAWLRDNGADGAFTINLASG